MSKSHPYSWTYVVVQNHGKQGLEPRFACKDLKDAEDTARCFQIANYTNHPTCFQVFKCEIDYSYPLYTVGKPNE